MLVGVLACAQPMQNGHGERGRFTRSRLSAAQQIAAPQHMGHGLGLDGSGGLVAFGSNGAKDGLAEPEVFKVHESDVLESGEFGLPVGICRAPECAGTPQLRPTSHRWLGEKSNGFIVHGSDQQ